MAGLCSLRCHFQLAHGTNPNVSVLGLVNIALVGILFAYMFDATKSLWLPIGYHITWNYFQGNVFGFAVSGTTPHGIYNVSVENGNALTDRRSVRVGRRPFGDIAYCFRVFCDEVVCEDEGRVGGYA